MNRRLLWALPVLLGLLLWLGSEATEGGVSSTLSKGADGWLGLRRALQEGDRPTRLLKRPWHLITATTATTAAAEITSAEVSSEAELDFDPLDVDETLLVTAFPWQRGAGEDELRGLNDWLRRGGTVVVAYSDVFPGPWEGRVLEGLGMGGRERLRPAAPWSPISWWAYRTQRWTLEPEPAAGPLPRLELGAVDRAPLPPDGAHILYRRPPLEDETSAATKAGSAPSVRDPSYDAPAMIFTFERLGGRVLVLPARLWSNGELLKAGNLASVEGLAGRLGVGADTAWCFDEYHHGSVDAALVRSEVDRLPWDLFFLHLGLLYGLALWTLARPFGPVWQERPAHAGSTAAFLESLGSFHHRLGHHRDAARRMRTRLLDLYPRWSEDTPDLPTAAQADAVSSGRELVAFARRLASFQGRGTGPPKHPSRS